MGDLNMNDENFSKSKVEQIEDTLIKLKELGVLETEIVKRYEDKILSLKNNELSYFFAKNIEGADVKAHGKIILDSKDLKFNFLFARDIGRSDFKAHEQIILDSEDLAHNLLFLDLEKSDKNAHKRVINKPVITYDCNFLDNALDEMIKENNEENKSMQKRS